MNIRDYIPHEDIDLIRPSMIQYFKNVSDIDMLKTIKLDLKDQEITIKKIDAEVVRIIDDRCKIRLALIGNDVIGIMIYHIIYKCVLVIRGLYVIPEYRGKRIGTDIVDSLAEPGFKIIFQTHIGKRPRELFEWIKKWRLKHRKLRKEKDLITWECDWENNNGI